MFKVNDTVLYSSYGVCKITEIAKRDLNGIKKEYYTLKPVYDKKSTVFVPVDNERLVSKIHKVLSVDEIYELIYSMPEEDTIWIDDESERKEYYSRVLQTGDRRELIQMIKSLYKNRQELASNKKKQHISDERFFRDAEKMLYEEFAHVLDIKRDQVLPFILNQIQVQEKV